MGVGRGRMGEEVRRLRNTNRKLQNSYRDVKHSVGNGVAEALICVTCGPEQWWGLPEGVGGVGWRGAKG